MTEPSPSRPVPGPPGNGDPSQPAAPADARFADLDQQPVTEHLAAFEAEHDRLQRELGTIDRL
jgi:hypothetical protein